MRPENRTKRVKGKAAKLARAWRNARLIGLQTPQQKPTQAEVDARTLITLALLAPAATTLEGIDRSGTAWWRSP